MNLTIPSARMIINKLGETGTPPENGASYFSVGLEKYFDVINEEYLQTNLQMGLSSFKLLVGDYGAGKTHFLYVLREFSWKHNFCVSIVKLSPASCPFDKLELVYKNLVIEISSPPISGDIVTYTEMGIEYILDRWFESMREKFMKGLRVEDPQDSELINRLQSFINSSKLAIESSSYKNAVKEYFRACIRNDETSKAVILSWLKGEKSDTGLLKNYRIFERLSKSTAFLFIRSLCQFIREIDYSGLLIFFDEGERMSSISGAKQKKTALDNLRQIVDEAGNSRLPGVLFVYAITPQIETVEITEYPALRDRLRANRNLSALNPLSVRIDIEDLDISSEELLEKIAVNLIQIYEIAYTYEFPPEVHNRIKEFAHYAASRTLSVNVRRLFVKSMVSVMNYIRSTKRTPSFDQMKSIFVETASELT